ncbi:glycosyltransferase family 39 protein [Candidatus Roizmanbacteria bacterium]|nr:glycosyltransferase family 39 protein [Candidatus Roizmanbacteria bacterium]
MEAQVAYLKKYRLPILLLFLIFLFGLYLRNLYLPDTLLFMWEQGRDLSVAKDIATLKKLSLIGPKTDVEGIFHGVFYYYFLALIYSVTRGNPASIISIFTIVNTLSVVVVYFIGKEVFRNKLYAYLSALLCAVSFNVIIYGRWLSNASFSIFVATLFFYTLTKLVKTKQPVWLVPTFFFVGLLSHFELLNLLDALFLTCIVVLLRRISLKNIYAFFAGAVFFFTITPFILFDLRHQFILTKGLQRYFTESSNIPIPFALRLKLYMQGLFQEFTNTLFPADPNGAFILLIFMLLLFFATFNSLYRERKTLLSFLFICLFWTLPYIFLLKDKPLEQFYAGTAIPIILLFCFFLEASEKYLKKSVTVAVIFLVSAVNIFYTVNALKNRNNIFYHSANKKLIYKDQLAALDYIFSTASGPFIIDAFTIPFFHTEGWNYLYLWSGETKYPAVYRKSHAKRPQMIYLVIEPHKSYDINSPDVFWLNNWLKEQDKASNIVQKKRIGNLEIQVRRIKS